MKKSPWTEPSGTKKRPSSGAADELEDPLNPSIPRAPLIPHDIARMPNAALPVWSHPPDERGGDRPTLSAASDGSRDHVDARPPPGATPSTYQSAAMPPHTDSLPRFSQRPADPSIRAPRGELEATTAADSPRPTAVEANPSAEQGWTRTQRWIMVALFVLIAALGAAWIVSALK